MIDSFFISLPSECLFVCHPFTLCAEHLFDDVTSGIRILRSGVKYIYILLLFREQHRQGSKVTLLHRELHSREYRRPYKVPVRASVDIFPAVHGILWSMAAPR